MRSDRQMGVSKELIVGASFGWTSCGYSRVPAMRSCQCGHANNLTCGTLSAAGIASCDCSAGGLINARFGRTPVLPEAIPVRALPARSCRSANSRTPPFATSRLWRQAFDH